MFNETSCQEREYAGLGQQPVYVDPNAPKATKMVKKLTKWGFNPILGGPPTPVGGYETMPAPAPAPGGDIVRPGTPTTTEGEGGLLGGALPDWALWVGIGFAALFFFKK